MRLIQLKIYNGVYTCGLPYENSQRCNPIDGTVPVRIFLARALSDIRNSGIFGGNVGKKLNRCPIRVLVREVYPFVLSPRLVWNEVSGMYSLYYPFGWEIQMLTVIAETLNMTAVTLPASYTVGYEITHVRIGGSKAKLENGRADLVIGEVSREETLAYNMEVTRGYYHLRTAWCTPCAIKRLRWSRIFRIFSTDLWISFILSLVLAVITMVCISNYGLRFYSSEFAVYRNVSSISANIIAVLLGVSVTTQPRTKPLRVFFFSWVCYSVAFSTVFQAYLTSFLIDTGYEVPIKTMDQMLKSRMKFGFPRQFKPFFNDSNDSVVSSILKGMVFCPDLTTCLNWARTHRNISTICTDLDADYSKSFGLSTDENNRPLLCDLEDGDVVHIEIVTALLKGNPLYNILMT
jgi:hypothetical protein